MRPPPKGAFYDDTAVARYLDTAREMDSLETFYERKIACFSESGQSDSAFSYIERFQHMKRPKAYKEMRDSLTNLADNEYAAYLYLRLTHRKSPEELQERLNRFSPATRESYLGKSLESMLPILSNISEGNKPKDFTLTDKNGNSVSLSDYHGKYLLLFYYGVCGGVFQTDPHLTDIYHEYHDKGLEMLGICRDGDIAAAYPPTARKPTGATAARPPLSYHIPHRRTKRIHRKRAFSLRHPYGHAHRPRRDYTHSRQPRREGYTETVA